MTFHIYQLECYDFTKSKIYKIRGSVPVGELQFLPPFLPDYDIQQYSLSTNCCTTTIIILKKSRLKVGFQMSDRGLSSNTTLFK